MFLVNGLLSCQRPEQPPVGANHSQMIQRTAMYMTMAELRQLVSGQAIIHYKHFYVHSLLLTYMCTRRGFVRLS